MLPLFSLNLAVTHDQGISTFLRPEAVSIAIKNLCFSLFYSPVRSASERESFYSFTVRQIQVLIAAYKLYPVWCQAAGVG